MKTSRITGLCDIAVGGQAKISIDISDANTKNNGVGIRQFNVIRRYNLYGGKIISGGVKDDIIRRTSGNDSIAGRHHTIRCLGNAAGCRSNG